MNRLQQHSRGSRYLSAWCLALCVLAASCLFVSLAAHNARSSAGSHGSTDLSAPAPLILPAAAEFLDSLRDYLALFFASQSLFDYTCARFKRGNCEEEFRYQNYRYLFRRAGVPVRDFRFAVIERRADGKREEEYPAGSGSEGRNTACDGGAVTRRL